MKIALSAEAEIDLEEIADFIAKENPARAISFARHLREKCDALATFPARFPLIPRREIHGIRKMVVGSYLIFYRIVEDTVIVVHILSGAVDYERKFAPD